jgi:hypothetical protein
MSTGCCTRCSQVGLIRLRGILDWDVPYALCATCFGVYRGLDDAAAARFAVDLWQRGAVAALESEGQA